ncbi:MAG: TatD family hydrolase [Peptococcaceae bacterium]|nr:TatD family hydrolase [Peptococcaceae bacterium]
MIVESHAHIDDQRFDVDREEVIARLRARGVGAVINVGYDLASSRKSLALAAKYPEIYAAVGIHPHDVSAVTEQEWEALASLARQPKVVAIGEIGLDYYRDLSPRAAQRDGFAAQLHIANDLGLPIIVHNRDAHQDVIDLIRNEPPQNGGVMHCFSGSWETAKIVLDLGLFISFAGPVTFKNAVKLQEVAAKIPLDRLLIETDSPYLTPEPLRGRRNEPANVQLVLEKLAAIKKIDPGQLGAITAANSCRLFGITLN